MTIPTLMKPNVTPRKAHARVIELLLNEAREQTEQE